MPSISISQKICTTDVRDIVTPQDYLAYLHDDTTGKISIAYRQGAEWIERTMTPAKAADTVVEWTGKFDSYVSMNHFKGRRRMENLATLRALWIDLDFHKLKRWEHWTAEGVWRIVVPEYLADARLPQPTAAIGSGRGLYLIWLFSPTPAQALPRWNACQKQIFESFRELGADRQALDATRVLRMVGTVNSRSGQKVQILGGDGYVWDFDALADEILPFTRVELHDLHVQRAIRTKDRKPTPRHYQSLQSLWMARLADINALITLRYPDGKVPTGERDSFIFLAGICMSWISSGDSQVLDQEIARFAQDHTPWPDREIRSRVSAVLKRTAMAGRGDTVEWQGRQVDPRYRLRTRTIIDWLGITDQEQRNMRTLIGSQEKRRRRGFNDTRQGYLTRHQQVRYKPWEELGMSRATWYAVGKPMPEPAIESPDTADYS